MSAHACNVASRGYTMGKARPAVIARALASSATPLAGRARIFHWLVKLVISETTLAAPEHGRARPEQKHTPAKASYACPFQAAVRHSVTWAPAYLLFSPSCASIVSECSVTCKNCMLRSRSHTFYFKAPNYMLAWTLTERVI